MDRIGKNDVMFVSVSKYYGDIYTYVEFQRVYSSKVYTLNSIHSTIRLENAINRLGRPITTVRNNQMQVNFPVIR